MKILFSIFLSLSLFSAITAQTRTIILVRHAEKDATPTANKPDPVLTPEGKARALHFAELVRKYNPTEIFSTNFLRTKFTADPLATNQNEKYRIFVEVYDPTKLDVFADDLMKRSAKCIVVVGHSNTTPKLANLLLKQEKYKDLPDSDYTKVFIITIKGKNVTDQVIEY